MAGHKHTIEKTLRDLSKKHAINVFVETGTFMGDTTDRASLIFQTVYSIELNKELHAKARERFQDKNNIVLIHGDSAKVLRKLALTIDSNCIFFLDAHWAGPLSSRASADTPLLQELSAIAERQKQYNDIIIIDDVSWFGEKGQKMFKKGESRYFPDGGLFERDWREVTREKILEVFKGEKSREQDDRLIIGDV